MGWLEGVLTGYADRHYQIQRDKMAEAQQAAEREERVFNTLLNSEYKDIQDYAAAGILDLSNPRRRKGGVAGWMGEVEKTPYLDMIKRTREKFSADPDTANANLRKPYYPWLGQGQGTTAGGTAPATPSIPTPAGSVAGAAPGAPSAALPSTSQVTGGPATAPTPAPPPPPVPVGQPLPLPTPPGAGAPAPAARSYAPPSPFFRGSEPQPAAGGDPGFVNNPVGAGLGAGAGAPPSYYQSPFLRGLEPAPGGDPGFVQNPTATGGPQVGATPSPQVELGGMGAPPMPPAGPPLPVSAGPPRPPGQVSGGLPGATTQPVGAMAAVRPSRTQLPGIFPTAEDTQRRQARSAVSGKIDGYAAMYMAQGYSEQEAYTKAANLLEADLLSTGRGGSGLSNAPMEFDLTHPDGHTERVLGWADRRSQQFVDLNGRPFAPGVQVSKAVPYSAVTGDVYYREALNNLNVHPGEVLGNPQIAQAVQAESNRLREAAAFGTTQARGQAAATNPLSGAQRVAEMGKLQARFNSYQAPMKLVEQHLRTLAASYAQLKAGNVAAWEPFRTSFVHVNEASIVMPSEFARSDAIGSLVDRVQGRLDQWMKGGGPLPEGLVDDMMYAAAAQWDSLQGIDTGFRSQVDEQLKDPAMVGIRPEQIFGAPRPRFDPWTIAKPEEAAANPAATPAPAPNPANPAPNPANPNSAPNPATRPSSGVPGGTGTYWDPKTGRYVTPGK